MKRYIVYWVLAKMIPMPCPDRVPKYDQFGRVTNEDVLYTTCLVGHYKMVFEKNSKVFVDRDSAIVFYRQALLAKLDSTRIDSTSFPLTLSDVIKVGNP